MKDVRHARCRRRAGEPWGKGHRALPAIVLLAAVLLPVQFGAGCARDPCERERETRPGWNEVEGVPERPYLELPAPEWGCGQGDQDRSRLGCPRLVNGEEALTANLDRAASGSVPGYRVYMLTSPDGRRWGEPIPIAAAFSSLGLYATDSALYLFGSSQIPVFTPYAVITALRTTDLEHWEGCAWNICREVNKGLVDTQPVRLEDGGLRMWYYSVPNLPGGRPFDPARLHGVHTLAFADLLDRWFFARGIGFADVDLADPSVAFLAGRWYLAASQTANRVILAESADGLSFRATGTALAGVSVPYLFTDAGTLKLLVQRYQDGAGPWPWVFSSRDGRTWSDQGPVVQGKPARGCTSPVMARFRGRYVLFCATPEGG